MSITKTTDLEFMLTMPLDGTNFSVPMTFSENGLKIGEDTLLWKDIRLGRMMTDVPRMDGDPKQFHFNIAHYDEPAVNLIQLITQCIESCPATNISSVLAYFNDLYGIK